MWIGINQALESSKSMKQIPLNIKNIKNEIMSDPQIIAENFADYFESVPELIRSKIKPPPLNDNKYLDHLHKNRPVNRYLVMNDTNINEVEHLINSVKDNSSSGPISIPSKFIEILAKNLPLWPENI